VPHGPSSALIANNLRGRGFGPCRFFVRRPPVPTRPPRPPSTARWARILDESGWADEALAFVAVLREDGQG
jgi:hypothetical protein